MTKADSSMPLPLKAELGAQKGVGLDLHVGDVITQLQGRKN